MHDNSQPMENHALPPEASPLKYKNVILMVGLSLVTLSAYMPYWLYTRTRKINGLARTKIPEQLVYGVLGTYVVAFVFLLGHAVFSYQGIYRLMALGLASTANTGLLIWCLLLRNTLSDEILELRNGRRLNLIYTMFFSIFFFQSKINEAIRMSTLPPEQ